MMHFLKFRFIYINEEMKERQMRSIGGTRFNISTHFHRKLFMVLSLFSKRNQQLIN